MTTPAIVEGGCTNPDNLGGYGSRTRLMRQRLEAFEERMGRPTKIERYKLPDEELVEFRLYRCEQPTRARTPSFWRSIFVRERPLPRPGSRSCGSLPFAASAARSTSGDVLYTTA